MGKLQEKVATLTGGTSGIGFRNVQDGLTPVMHHSFRCSPAWILLLDPGCDRRRRVAVESPVEVFGDETDMRRGQ